MDLSPISWLVSPIKLTVSRYTCSLHVRRVVITPHAVTIILMTSHDPYRLTKLDIDWHAPNIFGNTIPNN